MFPIRIREGFKDQRLCVMPQKVLEGFAQNPLICPLMPTAMGWYPNARYHYCEREDGAPEYILALCVSGEGWFQVEDTRDTLTANEAMLLPPNRAHVYGASESSPWTIHWVHFVGNNADYFMQQLPENRFKLPVDPDAQNRLCQLFTESYAAFAAGFVLERMIYATQSLHHLLALLLFNNRAFSPALQNDIHNLDATLAYLHQNIHLMLSLAEMAAHAKLSASHFSRLFKKQTGYSPMNYFIHLKMQHACMLLSTRMSVREIAHSLGLHRPLLFLSRIQEGRWPVADKLSQPSLQSLKQHAQRQQMTGKLQVVHAL